MNLSVHEHVHRLQTMTFFAHEFKWFHIISFFNLSYIYQVVESLTMASLQKNCLFVSDPVIGDCDSSQAEMCVRDFAAFTRGAQFSDSMFCWWATVLLFFPLKDMNVYMYLALTFKNWDVFYSDILILECCSVFMGKE